MLRSIDTRSLKPKDTQEKYSDYLEVMNSKIPNWQKLQKIAKLTEIAIAQKDK